VHDNEKPRRSQSEDLAEIADVEARTHADADARLASAPVNSSLNMIVAQMEADEEAAHRARERAQTAEEVEESARIRMSEVEIAIEVPFLRDRELRRTFSQSKRAHAAAAIAAG
jgi:hypothetical protein